MNQVFIPRSVDQDPRERGWINKPLIVALIHVAATAIGGAALGTLIGALAHAAERSSIDAPRTTAVLFVGICLYAVRAELRGPSGRLVERRKQVPRRWLLWRHRVLTAVAYGMMIGAGVLTKIRHATFYVVLCFFAVTPSVAAAATLGAAYGAARGGMVLVNWAYQRRLGDDALGSAITIEIPHIEILLAVTSSTFLIWIATMTVFS